MPVNVMVEFFFLPQQRVLAISEKRGIFRSDCNVLIGDVVTTVLRILGYKV